MSDEQQLNWYCTTGHSLPYAFCHVHGLRCGRPLAVVRSPVEQVAVE
ncbi:hypothetical protein ACP70R_040812 [Stipagrostis hirtigluma subsp. patula]